MSNPDARVDRDGVPIRIYEEPEGVTVSTGSYGGPIDDGVVLYLHDELVGEVPREAIEEDLAVLLDEAYDRTNRRVATSVE